MGGWWLDTAGAAQGVEPPDAPLAVGRQVFRALLAGDADGVFALLPSAEQDAPAHEAIARAVAGLAPCQGQDPPLISHAVTPTHVVVAAVFDPPCGVGAYADARACEVSVELLDGGWRPTLRERPLLRCVP